MSNSNLNKKLLHNLGANTYGQLITVAIQLVNVPLFLHYWNVAIYGEWLILSAIPSYLNLSDIGFASVAANDMTMRMGRDDRKGTLEVYQSIWLLISITSIIICSIAVFLVWTFPLTQIFSLHALQEDQVAPAIFMLLLQVIIGLQGGVLSAGFRSTGHYAYGIMINNTSRLLEWALVALTLAKGGGVVHVAAAILIGKVVGTIILWRCLHRQSSWLVLGYSAGKLKTIQQLFKPAIAFMAFPLGLALNIQGMVLIVGAFIGPAAVVIFTTYRTMTRVLVQMATLLNQAIWPEISAAYGKGSINIVQKIHQHSSSITFWIGLVGVVSIAASGDFIIDIWTHQAFRPNHILLLLLLTTSFINILWQTSWVVLMATNCHQRISIAFIISSTAGLAMSVLLSPYLDINGVALSLMITELPMFFLSINSSLTVLNDNWASYVKAIISLPFNLQRLYK